LSCRLRVKKQSTVYEWADDRRPDVAPNFRDLCLIVDAIAKFHKKKAASFKFLQEMISAVLAVTADEIDEAKTAAALTRCAGDISYSILEAKTPAERFGVYGKLNEAEDYLTSLKLKHINQQAGNA
jgi:hypothetical protein